MATFARAGSVPTFAYSSAKVFLHAMPSRTATATVPWDDTPSHIFGRSRKQGPCQPMAWPRMTTHATIHHFRVRRNPSREIGCTGSGPAEAMGSLKGCPAAHAGPANLPLRPPPEGARHSCLELDIHAPDPSLRSSKVWPVTLGWHQMVKGSWLSRPSSRIHSKMRSLRSASRLANRVHAVPS